MPDYKGTRGREYAADLTSGILTYNPPAYTPGANMTVMAVFKIPSGSVQNGGIIVGAGEGSISTDDFALQTLNTGALRGNVSGGVGVFAETDATELVAGDDVWHFAAFVYEGGGSPEVQIWLDGSFRASTVTGSLASLNEQTTDFGIGGESDGAGSSSNIVCRSAMILKRSLTTAQLTVAEKVLQSRDWRYAQGALATNPDQILLHFQPSWVGDVSQAETTSLWRDLGPLASPVTVNNTVAVVDKYRTVIV